MIQLSKPILEQLIRLSKGESVASSSFKGDVVNEMLDNDVIVPIVHGRRKTYKAVSPTAISDFLASNYEINDIEAYASFLWFLSFAKYSGNCSWQFQSCPSQNDARIYGQYLRAGCSSV